MSTRFWISTGLFLVTLAAARAATAPQVGDVAPPFSLRTLKGEVVALRTLSEAAPVVLVVLRGFPGYQCPLCTKQVHDFVTRANDFAAKGARVVMVYPGPAAGLEKKAGEFLADKAWPRDFVFLMDPDYTLTNAYGLRWDAKNETAFPATFVIGRDGRVKFAKVSKTHGGRTAASEVIGKL